MNADPREMNPDPREMNADPRETNPDRVLGMNKTVPVTINGF